mgnify:CR=1 FL=1
MLKSILWQWSQIYCDNVHTFNLSRLQLNLKTLLWHMSQIALNRRIFINDLFTLCLALSNACPWISSSVLSRYTAGLPGKMQAAASGGYGSFSGMSSGSNCFTIDICPDLLIAGIAAAAAAAFFLIYQGITMASRRRRRRNVDPTNASIVFDMLTLGKENSSRLWKFWPHKTLTLAKKT